MAWSWDSEPLFAMAPFICPFVRPQAPVGTTSYCVPLDPERVWVLPSPAEKRCAQSACKPAVGRVKVCFLLAGEATRNSASPPRPTAPRNWHAGCLVTPEANSQTSRDRVIACFAAGGEASFPKQPTINVWNGIGTFDGILIHNNPSQQHTHAPRNERETGVETRQEPRQKDRQTDRHRQS